MLLTLWEPWEVCPSKQIKVHKDGWMIMDWKNLTGPHKPQPHQTPLG